MGQLIQILVMGSTLYSLVVSLIPVPLDVIHCDQLSLELLSLMTYSYGCCSLFFCVPMPYRKHHFCQALLSFVRHLGLDFFSSLAVDSKPLVFFWLTKNLSISQPFLKARQVGISRLLN